jgi:hypothetical protein
VTLFEKSHELGGQVNIGAKYRVELSLESQSAI